MNYYAQHILRFRKIYCCLLLLFKLFILILWYKEANYGLLTNWYGNFYLRKIYRHINARRSVNLNFPKDLPRWQRLNISVVVIVNDSQHLTNEYQLAHQTIRCYCALHAYPLTVIDLAKWRHRAECPQQDTNWPLMMVFNYPNPLEYTLFMFRRHCALAKWLSMSPSVQYALFLDADMAVINPDHLLEHFLSDLKAPHSGGAIFDEDLVFYERIFNGEIMAGSYWARNSRFAIEVLHFWANFIVPSRNQFRGGTDNGAIHVFSRAAYPSAVFLDLICGHQCSELGAHCLSLWADARHFGELRPYELCVRAILGARQHFRIDFGTSAGMKKRLFTDAKVGTGTVRLVNDFRKYWSRDGWLTGNQWSPSDFIVHGWQNRRMDKPIFARWHSPLVYSAIPSPNNSFHDTNCSDPKKASLHWPYKTSFMVAEWEINAKLGAIVRQRRRDDLKQLAQILAN